MGWAFSIVLLIVGGVIGFACAALIVVASESDRKERKWWEE